MGKSFLILNEDANLAKVVAPLLEGRGHEVRSAESGREGLDIVAEAGLSLDAIICGEKLADIDAIGWIIKLRQANKDVKLVLVASTWKDQDLYQKLTKELGVNLIVQRPIKANLFGVQVETLFPAQTPITTDTGVTHDRRAQDHPPTSSSISAPSGLDGALDALRQRYLQVLPERLAAFSAAIEKAKSDENQLGEARRLAHNMKGTARSTAGCEKIGDAAARIESALDSIIKKQASDPTVAWSEIDSAYDAVKAEAAAATSAAGGSTSDGSPTTVADKAGRSNGNGSAGADIARARVMVVSVDNSLNTGRSLPDSPLPVELFQVDSAHDAVSKAGALALDAALIDATAEGAEASFKLARELRGLSGYEDLPLGFILDDAQSQHRIEAAHAGASVFLTKPLDEDSLAKAVHYLIGVREGGRPRILIVDDDEDFATLIATTLANEGMLVRSTQDPTKTEPLMEAFSPDIVLLDVNMPGVSGFDVCKSLRLTPRWQDVPILFLTAETGIDARVNAFEAGGDDYLPKPVAKIELLTRVKVRLERARLLRERTDKDVLTGLLLRRAFSEHLDAIMSECERHKLRFTACLLDVDHFKKVNDTYGHLAGDRVLAYFGQLLKKRFRVEDLRGRWGGEEFIMVFRHETKETMKGALQRVLDELSVTPLQGDHGETFYVSFSAGMVSFPEDGQTIHDLLQVADKRLYIAKEKGRKRVITEDQGES
jgi:diguanylate cyclase (GGDEF)-like protein